MTAATAVKEKGSKENGESPVRFGQQVRAGIVRDLKGALSEAEAVVVTSMVKVPTLDLNRLRSSLNTQDSTFLVVKNSLCRLTFRDLGWEGLVETLEGTCGISPVRKEIGAVCKLLATFSKDHEGFVLKGGILKGQVLQAADVKTLAQLPSRDVLLGQLAGIAQAPLRNLATVLQAPLRSLVTVFSAIIKNRGAL